MKETKDDRVSKANEFIRVIAGCGRNFFRGRDGRVASFFTKRGHVYFIDAGSQKTIYTMKRGPWCGFTDGDTLKVLVQTLVEYIRFGDKSNMGIGLCLEDVFSDSDPWGYGEAMKEVRAAAGWIFDLPEPEVAPPQRPATEKFVSWETCHYCTHWKMETINSSPALGSTAECDKLIGTFMNTGYVCVSGPSGFVPGDGGGMILLRTHSDFGCIFFEKGR